MVAVPSLHAFTKPDDDTVATDEELVLQVTSDEASDGVNEQLSCFVSPRAIDAVVGDTEIAVGGAADLTVT
jgi:hypothetical protein